MTRPAFAVRARLLIVPVALSAFVLAGCQSGNQGKYTQERVSIAKERMAQIKSGTEWQMARQQFEGGDLNKSLKTVDRSIALNPSVSKSHVLRGRILLEQGRLQDARDAFVQAEQLNPDNVDAHYFLGIIHERVGESDKAVERYTRAMELDSGNAQYLIAAAETLVQAGQLERAETLLNERKQFFEYNPAVRQTFGHIAMLRRQPEKAAQWFSEALLLAPDDTRVLEDLIVAQIESRQFAEAEVNIAKLLETESGKERRDLRQLRARCLMAINKPVEARALLQELTQDKEGGRDFRSWIELGNVAIVLKDMRSLRQAAARARAISPDRPEGYALSAMYCRMDNRPEDALAAAEEAIQRAPNDPSAFALKALVLQDLNRPVEAQQALATAQRLRTTAPMTAPSESAVTSHPDAGN
jgi:Flp pilus assembly protein TadD